MSRSCTIVPAGSSDWHCSLCVAWSERVSASSAWTCETGSKAQTAAQLTEAAQSAFFCMAQPCEISGACTYTSSRWSSPAVSAATHPSCCSSMQVGSAVLSMQGCDTLLLVTLVPKVACSLEMDFHVCTACFESIPLERGLLCTLSKSAAGSLDFVPPLEDPCRLR